MGFVDDLIDEFRRRQPPQQREQLVEQQQAPTRAAPRAPGPLVSPSTFARWVALTFSVAAAPLGGAPAFTAPGFGSGGASFAAMYGGAPVGYLSPPFSAFPGGPAIAGGGGIGAPVQLAAATGTPLAGGAPSLAGAGAYPPGFAPIGAGTPDVIARLLASGSLSSVAPTDPIPGVGGVPLEAPLPVTPTANYGPPDPWVANAPDLGAAPAPSTPQPGVGGQPLEAPLAYTPPPVELIPASTGGSRTAF